AQNHPVRNLDAVEHDFVEVMLAGHQEDGPNLDVRVRHLDDEDAEAGMPLLAARGRAAQDDENVRVMPVTVPDLRAEEPPAAIDALGPRPHGSEVRADVRLAVPRSDHEVAPGD